MTKVLAIASLTLLVLSLSATELRADNTLRGRRLRVVPAALDATPAASDTIFTPEGIILSGYDKPLTASREAMLVTNRTDSEITGLHLIINYLDLSGRELHSAGVTIDTPIPAGATRRVTFPSWDSQKSYYYHLGKKPRTAHVTPYTVRCTVDWCLIPHSTP